MAQEIIFGLFPFSRNFILKWGVLASREAGANFFPGVLIGWYQIYGLFMGSLVMQPMTTLELPLKKYQPFKKSKKSIFFSRKKNCAIIMGSLTP